MFLNKIPKDLRKFFIFIGLLSITLSVFTITKSHMNNWLIFRASFHHLMAGTDLYVLYPQEHHDLFKYSPTFALFMAPLAILPDWLGGTLWNLVGALFLLCGVYRLPLSDSHKKALLWISLPELIGSTQGFQSNIHMIALLLFFWITLEERKMFLSSFHLASSFFIKLFGLVGGTLLLFQKNSANKKTSFLKDVAVMSLVFLGLGLLPVLFVGWDSLVMQYKSWWQLLRMDASQSYGFSLMGIFHGMAGWNFNPLPWEIAGGLSLLFSFYYFRNTDQTGRLLGLVSICYFMVLFNHKSESPTFIIAMVAFGIHQGLIQSQRLRWILIALTLGCVSVLYSDLFRHFKQSHFDPYAVKVWPFLILYPMSLFHWGVNKEALPTSVLSSSQNS